MQHTRIESVLRQLHEGGKTYLEFIRVPSMSVGLGVAAEAKEDVTPHGEDEVYYVISGRAKFRCAGEVQDVRAGSILFVERGVEHRFFDIGEELVVLVVFGPAEGTLKT